MTFGRRDGEPFLHGHGVWRHEDGFRAAGHVMPKDSQFAETGGAEAWILSAPSWISWRTARPDSVCSRLASCRRTGHHSAARRSCRLKPNEPIHSAIERTAAEHGIERRRCHGIGSLVGCTFADGQVMESAASELLIRKGTLFTRGSGQAKAKLDIAIVDTECTIFEGEIAYGVDAVCITFEVLIVEE